MSGGTLAAYLAERGWDVVRVEKGGCFRAEAFTQREEHRTVGRRLYINPH